MKVLHRRPLWESIFAQMWSQHLPIMIAKGTFMSFRKDKRFWSVCRTINDCKCMMFIKVLLRTYLLLKPRFSQKKRTNNWWVDLKLSWLKAKWVNSVVASHIYCHELICVRKTKLLCLGNDFLHTRYDLHMEISISCHSHYEIILIADTP